MIDDRTNNKKLKYKNFYFIYTKLSFSPRTPISLLVEESLIFYFKKMIKKKHKKIIPNLKKNLISNTFHHIEYAPIFL